MTGQSDRLGKGSRGFSCSLTYPIRRANEVGSASSVLFGGRDGCEGMPCLNGDDAAA